MDPPLFSVLIVNFNGVRHLGPCLSALARQSFPRHRFETVVVDNASIDGSEELVRTHFPWVRWVRLPGNTGFTGGNNAGLSFAHGQYVVLLNNDTVADPHWLAELAAAAEAAPGGSAASKLVFAADPTTLNSAGLQLLRDGRGLDRGFRHPDRGQFEREEPVFAGCGAAVAVRADQIPGRLFDPRYFLYYEDLDAAWRTLMRGEPVRYAPRSLVRHVQGGSAGDESPVFRFHVERNRAVTNLRNADPFLALWNVVGLVARVGRAAWRAARGRERWAMARATAAALASFARLAPAVLFERYVTRSQTQPLPRPSPKRRGASTLRLPLPSQGKGLGG